MYSYFGLSKDFIPFPYLKNHIPKEYQHSVYQQYYRDNGRTMDLALYKDVLSENFFTSNDFHCMGAFNFLIDGTYFENHQAVPMLMYIDGTKWTHASLADKQISCMSTGDAIYLGVNLPYFVPESDADSKMITNIKNTLSNNVTRMTDNKIMLYPFAVQFELYEEAECLVWMSDPTMTIVLPIKAKHYDFANFSYKHPTFHVDPNFTGSNAAHVVEIRSQHIFKSKTGDKVKNRRVRVHLGGFSTVGLLNGVILPEHHKIPKDYRQMMFYRYRKTFAPLFPELYGLV